MTFPVVLGGGKRWFDGEARPANFTLDRTATFSAGVVSSLYRRAGDIRTGTVGDA
jgi:hypothetical protein